MNKNTRRFSDDQIRSLESIFKLETKLETKKKLQVARELKLHPRQVAIWFQNRRARWKSKHLEQEYKVLEANYENLNTQFGILKEEKETLLTELQKLRDMLKDTHLVGNVSKGLEGKSTHKGLDDEDIPSSEVKVKQNCLIDRLDQSLIIHSDDDGKEKTGFLDKYERPSNLSLCEQLDGSFEPTAKWCNLESDDISNQACGGTNWWDF